ncbi:MAG TPA: type II secretion system minor pseudopilin GspI [Burkholderiales bacterium]|nr:type II secretion system minor pseudopilin GspI [Burkholderiales bacterium]
MTGGRDRTSGFTLVEILIALAVLAIALTATAHALGSAVDTTGALRERMLARWVAEDRLTELELKNEWPALDTKEGDATMGGRRFHWVQETGVTPVTRLRRVEVSVMLPGAKVALAHLTGFVEQTGTSITSSTASQTGDLSQMGSTPTPPSSQTESQR